MKLTFSLCATLLALVAANELAATELVVGPTETVTVDASADYETITVRGTLNVTNGAKLTAPVISLGPEAGDTAVVNVFGDATTFGATASVITIGENGGTAKLVAPDDGKEHYGVWDQIWAFAYKSLTVKAAAAVGADGYIDIMELKKSATSGGVIVNEHATGIVRITATGNARFGGNQYYGGTFFTGKIEIEQKTAGKGIYLGPRYAPMTLAPANTGLAFKNVAFLGVCGVGDNSTQGKVTVNAGVAWNGTCALLVADSKSGWTIGANDVLPFGAGKGAMRISSVNGKLNLGACTQHLNGLEAVGGRPEGDYAVVGSDGSKLVFGEDDVDGSVSGAIDPRVVVEKTGAGTLVVSNALSMGAMSVTGGKLRVAASAKLSGLSVAEDATLTVDGVTLAIPASACEVKGTLELLNGGRLISSIATESDRRVKALSAAGTLLKTGAGALVLENPVSMPTDVKVEAGTLAFSAGGYAIPLYRFSCTKWYGGHLGFFRFALLNADGSRGCTDLTYRDPGTAAADLNPGEVTVPSSYENSFSYWKADSMFSTSSDGRRFDISSPTFDDEGITEMNFTFAPPTEGNAAIGYNWSPCWTGHPVNWRLLASFDGGESWIAVDQQASFRDWYLADKNWIDGADSSVSDPPLAFNLSCEDHRAATPGATGLPTALRLEVASGALADFGNVTDGQRVDGLTVACAGAGAVSNIVFAASGTLAVVTAAGDGRLSKEVVLPLEIRGATGTDNLEGWTVTVDGQPTSRQVSFKDGRLVVSRKGLLMIVR